MQTEIRWFEDCGMQYVEEVGGKNASLGEMIVHLHALQIKVPQGFATTVHAYRQFLIDNDLVEPIQAAIESLDLQDLSALKQTAQHIRELILGGQFSPAFCQAVSGAYQQLRAREGDTLTVAVRSSATAEDLVDASFAGQQDTYLNISGEDNVLDAIKRVFASLFTERAIAYRAHHGFDHQQVGISAGIQRMVRSDLAASGVMFTLDTESGFDQVVFITGAYGLGELIVQGSINPDEFYVYKPNLASDKPAIIRRQLGSKLHKMVYHPDPCSQEKVLSTDVSRDEQLRFCLTDAEITQLATMAVSIEQHYKKPMDIEWAKDGISGELFIVQARPETVNSQGKQNALERYQLHSRGKVLTSGRSIGQRIGQGHAKILKNISEIDKLQAGDVLVTDMTDPDWEPIMKRAAAIVTNRGGRTCHAAIIARELGIPAIVGCGDATSNILANTPITVSCAEGDTGFVYDGLQDFSIERVALDHMPDIPVKLTLNVGNPDQAMQFASLPNDGVGLARMEFIINHMIGIHPQALLELDTLPADLQQTIRAKTAAYANPVAYYLERLKEGIATIAAVFYPKPVIVRLSDFKTNEYINLIGGTHFEPNEENPMLGYRGCARYLSANFRDSFALECQALQEIRETMGLNNVKIMVPFVRTLSQANDVIALLAEHGLRRQENGLEIYMMCEVPSNAILADEFLQYFDGFSIGSNDLTQLTLGLDRDSGLLAHQFDERDPAVKALLGKAIAACRAQNKYVGICGQGPSDYPELAAWLLEQGIASLSLNPDTVIDTWLKLAKHADKANKQAVTA